MNFICISPCNTAVIQKYRKVFCFFFFPHLKKKKKSLQLFKHKPKKEKKKKTPSTWSFDSMFFPSSHMPDLFVKTSNKHESDSQPNMLESKAIIDFAILINGGPSLVIDYSVSLQTRLLSCSLPALNECSSVRKR